MKYFFIALFVFSFFCAKSGIPSTVLQVQDLSQIFNEYDDDLQVIMQEFSLKTGIQCYVVSGYSLTGMSSTEIREVMSSKNIEGLLIVFNRNYDEGLEYEIELYVDEYYSSQLNEDELRYAKLEVMYNVLYNNSGSNVLGESIRYYRAAVDGLEYLMNAANDQLETAGFSVAFNDSTVKDMHIYYKGVENTLYVNYTNADTTAVKVKAEISLASKKQIVSSEAKIKLNEKVSVKLDSIPEGKWTVSCIKNGKEIGRYTFYVRNEKYEYACIKCGRDLEYTKAKLIAMFPSSVTIKVKGDTIAEIFNDGCKKMNLNTCLMHAQFFSQCQHESGNFSATVESYNYYLLHMLAIFKRNEGTESWFKQSFWDDKTYLDYVNTHVYEKTNGDGEYDMSDEEDNSNYKTLKWKNSTSDSITVPYHYPSGDKFARKTDTFIKNSQKKGNYNLIVVNSDKKLDNGKRLFNDAYWGLNGNLKTNGSQDGFNFRGRGMIQLTGRSNYESSMKTCNKIFTNNSFDWVNNPDDLAKTKDMVYSAFGWLYNAFSGNLKQLHTTNVSFVTGKVNAGMVGLSDRKNKFNILENNFLYDCNPK